MRLIVRMLIATLTLIAIGLCGLLAVGIRPNAAIREAARTEALAQWRARSFQNYRMVLEQGNCTADYEVRGERIGWGYEAPCGRGQARTIDNLFAVITADQQQCSDPSCACIILTTHDVHYNKVLGYPEQIVIHRQINPNWQSQHFWDQVAQKQQNPCPTSNQERVMSVRDLIPHLTR